MRSNIEQLALPWGGADACDRARWAEETKAQRASDRHERLTRLWEGKAVEAEAKAEAKAELKAARAERKAAKAAKAEEKPVKVETFSRERIVAFWLEYSPLVGGYPVTVESGVAA